ncbi:MAG: methyltransferase [Chloroflexota bacterium]
MSAVGSRAGFLWQWVRNPRAMGSVTPSSRFLVRAILNQIDFASAHRVCELGPGNGVFTGPILDHLAPGSGLLALDTNAGWVHYLDQRFGDARLYARHASAEHLLRECQEVGWDGADVVVSGIPYSLLPREVTRSILVAVRESLAPGGLFVGYQYSRYLRPLLIDVFGNVRYGFEPRNFPPAFVYTARKTTT